MGRGEVPGSTMGNDVFEVEMFDNPLEDPLQPSSAMAGAGPRASAGSMSPGGSSRRRRRGRGPLPEHLEREDALAGGFTRQASDRLFAMIDQGGDGQLSLEEVKRGLEQIKGGHRAARQGQGRPQGRGRRRRQAGRQRRILRLHADGRRRKRGR